MGQLPDSHKRSARAVCRNVWMPSLTLHVRSYPLLRIAKGSFRWPRSDNAAWHLTPDEFNWLIADVDWLQV
ncbi:hypothetical protein B5N75_22355 [Salmonella enterica]|uniref:Uncharacterized protein n=1 Tax=Salmonella enterica I TaxID=59201 RepID=A0A7Z1PED2_SALET|nr:hypothetical protein [Salmonella enterica subsp. diarizonae]EAO9251237.1 hypothetical protein [Salmonella enterica]PTU34033.1 hypothetical protein DBZ43_25955 [Salmonella enterica subsp. enterica]EAO9967839.1 hypothetical protein [Salmonella enterica]EAS3314235.1 hypothetical protein [Salmonella enterica]